MKKILLYLAIIFFAYSCGSKRVIYNNQNDIPKKEKKLKRSKQKSKKVKKIFLAPRISNIEDKVKHDVIAFLTSIAERSGKEARYLHKGMTSSDVLDTCFNLQLKQSGEILLKDIDE